MLLSVRLALRSSRDVVAGRLTDIHVYRGLVIVVYRRSLRYGMCLRANIKLNQIVDYIDPL
jgi:hypothetical protein